MSSERLENLEQYTLTALQASRAMSEADRHPDEIIGLLTAAMSTILLAMHGMRDRPPSNKGAAWVHHNQHVIRKVFMESFAESVPDLDFLLAAIDDGTVIFDLEGNMCSERPLVVESRGTATLQ